MTLDFSTLLPYTDELVMGLLVTVMITVAATLLGIAAACALVWFKLNGATPLRVMIQTYIELLRNTPFIVQLFFIFFGLPALGVTLAAWQAALIAMTLNLAAYSTEILRAGVEAIPRGQFEAARVLGLSRRQTWRHVVLVPAMRNIYPALTNQCIIVMLGSAVISQISVNDLTWVANFIASRNFRNFEAYLVVTLIYLALAVGMRQLFRLAGWYWLGGRQGRAL
ncbi:amino acid ABC transporter permease [Kushneria aurantia]|uniref:Amino acid ABC transporter permease n=1 Tax=Kushneria aurantia TaxID=504092 RepID=A0ABV6G1U9_9GAMM|nr:amino acid ABC transporter permease [Kushneria aurantia]